MVDAEYAGYVCRFFRLQRPLLAARARGATVKNVDYILEGRHTRRALGLRG
jgi:hypothetical protein